MSNTRAILTTIHSTQKTEKITHAMELVSVSKLGKTQQAMSASKPYSEKMRQVIGHIGMSQSEYRHPFLKKSTKKRVGLIVISSDRGLCGSLNINLFKSVLTQIDQWQQQKIECDLCVIGRKAVNFFSRLDLNLLASATHLGEQPTVLETVGVAKVMIDAFLSETLQGVYLAHNHFVNVMTQTPNVGQLLPIEAPQTTDQTHWDYLYEPDAKAVLDVLFKRYIESQVHQGVIENIACEQAARMMAMKNASENAKDIINGLKLVYNKARQASITQELAEIISGADAV